MARVAGTIHHPLNREYGRFKGCVLIGGVNALNHVFNVFVKFGLN